MMQARANSCLGKHRIAAAVAGSLVLALAAVRPATAQPPAKADPRDDASPWGIASGAEWSGDYPKFNPMLHKVGVRWLRLFPEWQTIQPKRDQWNWKTSDAMAADARANDIHLLGVWAYLAHWASADGGTRKFPIKDIRYWRDYITGTVERYHKEVKYWEVWNEFNGSFGDSKNKVKDYANAKVVACRLGAANTEDGLKQVNAKTTVVVRVKHVETAFRGVR